MTEQKFHLSIRKAADPQYYPVIEIEIRIDPDPQAGSISAIKTFDLEDPLTLAPATVRQNFTIRYDLTPDKARLIGDWFKLAAQAADQLDSLVQRRTDLSRPVVARIVGPSIHIEFEE